MGLPDPGPGGQVTGLTHQGLAPLENWQIGGVGGREVGSAVQWEAAPVTMESRPERAQSAIGTKTWSSDQECVWPHSDQECVVGREAVIAGAVLMVGAMVFRLWPASEPGRAWSSTFWRSMDDEVCIETTSDALPS